LVVVKHMLWYLKGTMHFGPRYVSDGELVVHSFSDFDCVGSANDRSTLGCCFNLGLGVIS
jgi:hypothetical protein